MKYFKLIFVFLFILIIAQPVLAAGNDCVVDGGKVNFKTCQEINCCVGLKCTDVEVPIMVYQPITMQTGSISMASCSKPSATELVDTRASKQADESIIFKPNISIPGSIKIGGKDFTVRQGEGVVVTGDTIANYIKLFYQFFIAMLAVVAVVMVTWGAFKRIMAAGNAESIKTSNDTIFGAVIGLVLALISYSLLNLINPSLTSFKSLEIYQVRKESWTGEQSDSGVADISSDGIYYKQCDPQWGSMPYVADNNKACNLCSSGCGATAVAIVLKSKGIDVTPYDIGQYAIQIGARKGCSNGTNVSTLINKPKSTWGVKTETVSDFSLAMARLDKGGWLIASVKQVPVAGKCQTSKCGVGVCFCGGHYLVLAGKNGETINIIDPSRVGITSMTVTDLKKYLNNGFFNIWKDGYERENWNGGKE